MPAVARIMHLLGLATEAMEVKNIFENDVLARIEKMPLLDIDVDVDYNKWANMSWPLMQCAEKTGVYTDPQRYFKEDDDPTLHSSYKDRFLRLIEKEAENDLVLKSFNAHEQVSGIISAASAGILMNETHLERIVNAILNELRIVLKNIYTKTNSRWRQEQYKSLFEEVYEKYKYSSLVSDAKREFEEWKEKECYDEPNAEQLEDYRIRIMMELFDSGIFQSQLSSAVRTHKKKDEIDFDSLDDESQRNYAWKNYDQLRHLYEYNTGMLERGEAHRLGILFYQQRREVDAKAHREAFFKFEFKLRYVQDEMNKLHGTDTSEKEEELNYYAPEKNIKEMLKKESAPKKPKAAKAPKTRVTMTLKKKSGVTKGHLTLFFQQLTIEGWIEGNEADFKALFSGQRDDDCELIWTGKYGKGTLVELFKQVIDAGLVELPAGYTLPAILEGHFKNKDGQWLTGLDKGNSAHAQALPVIKECVDLLKTNPKHVLRRATEEDEDFQSVYDSYDHQDLHLHKR